MFSFDDRYIQFPWAKTQGAAAAVAAAAALSYGDGAPCAEVEAEVVDDASCAADVDVVVGGDLEDVDGAGDNTVGDILEAARDVHDIQDTMDGHMLHEDCEWVEEGDTSDRRGEMAAVQVDIQSEIGEEALGLELVVEILEHPLEQAREVDSVPSLDSEMLARFPME